ncbi:MAG: lysine--tRNA ligase, partial [Acidobacteriota bacterium]|nr:lysine--tRNA ligase [Acidobacteriota bacterium]
HNPEFTMLEFYQAYANYEDLMTLTEELIKEVAREVNGTTKAQFTPLNGPRAREIIEIDLSTWRRLSMLDAIIEFWPPEAGLPPTIETFASFNDLNVFLSIVIGPMGYAVEALPESHRKHHLWRVLDGLRQADDSFSPARYLASHAHDEGRELYILKQALGKAIATVFEAVAEEHLIEPTIIYDFPLAVSPLSKVKPNDPDWVERFEFYIGGFELGNAFSELNDPDDQRRRFLAQLEQKERGDDEAHVMDEDYVRALGYGLPPTAGEGIGIDRLTMVLTGSRSIRDVILFPLMRPLAKSPQPTDAEPHDESAE